MSLTIKNPLGRTIARVSGAGDVLPAGSPIATWLAKGVPALEGSRAGDGSIAEKETTVLRSDPEFWIAFAEACERRGWAVEEDA